MNFKLKYSLIYLFVPIILSACTSKHLPLMPPMPKGTSAHFISQSPDNIQPDVKGPESIGGSMGDGAAAGAGAGFVAGLQCGPLFIICSPVGALVGSGAGTIAGGIEGSIIALSKEEKVKMEEAIRSRLGGNKLEEALSHQLLQRASLDWNILQDAPETLSNDTLIHYRIEGFRFLQYSQSQLSISLLASLSMEFESDNKMVKSKRYLYNYRSPKLPVSHWLADDGKNIALEVNIGLGEIADLMAASLLTPPAPKSRPSFFR
ncbi:hypothetical protein [Aliikangiella sp. G2MR2-5]|uniref:hypothetical protein n=1 Tax=Aliikangiella sp. G2MR2-5 TaxID=2788943 RepID=UPI0018AB9CC5|nr:hypothetical protein [Aliikangiella sp. G2MR2-5]